ncbi:MAG: MBL fold metallo-hydrolase [Deltaproteobacteria bacterium]
MIFDELNGDTACKSYLIADEETREAAIVDPLLERLHDYLMRLRQSGLRLTWAIDSHTHADHLSGVRELARRTGAVSAGAPAGSVARPLHEGDGLAIGSVELSLLSTPGHTADSLVLRLPDRVLTGDTLLVGASGRTDLPSGDAEAEWASLQRLKELPDETLVFPAHVYGTRASSTIGLERESNPRLQMDRAAFLRLMTTPRTDRPRILDAALTYNRQPAEGTPSRRTGSPDAATRL